MTSSKSILLFFALGGLFSCQSLSDRRGVENSIITTSVKNSKQPKFVKQSGPKLLSFKQLTQLLENPKPTGDLAVQYNKLLSTPFIDNSAYYRSGIPKATVYPGLGPSIRLTTWNVEKSVRVPEVAQMMTSQSRFEGMMRSEIRNEAMAKSEAIRQRAALAASDILLLQEMDIGHCRSGYLFAAKHLAQKLNMNFAYAPQQLEIDPVHLGVEHVKFENGDVDMAACRAFQGQPAVYRGVFGVAVLSRYPIKSAQLFQLKAQPYDWYQGEIVKPDFLERSRRKGAEALFKFQPVREVKVGGRAFTKS